MRLCLYSLVKLILYHIYIYICTIQICTLSVSSTFVKLGHILRDEGKLSIMHIILSMNCTALKAAVPKP